MSELVTLVYMLKLQNYIFRSVPETQLHTSHNLELHDDDGFELVLRHRQRKCFLMAQRLRVEMENINDLSEPQNESSSEGN